jgi:DNA-binding GntR family transcriptional regulator
MTPSAQQKPQMGGTTEMAIQRLLLLIMCGKLAPGEQIRQQEMAAHFGISRVPLREALNVLAQQGLLLHRPNQGYFVAKRGPGELAQLRRMLHLLENEVMQSLEWPGSELLAKLRQLNEAMRATIDQDDWSEMPRLNREFHNLILTSSPLQLIADEVRRLVTLADPFFAAKFDRPSMRAKTVEEHDRVIAALSARDRPALMHAVETHRYSNAEGLSRTIANLGTPLTWSAPATEA